jgi:hypothetical protein
MMLLKVPLTAPVPEFMIVAVRVVTWPLSGDAGEVAASTEIVRSGLGAAPTVTVADDTGDVPPGPTQVIE